MFQILYVVQYKFLNSVSSGQAVTLNWIAGWKAMLHCARAQKGSHICLLVHFTDVKSHAADPIPGTVLGLAAVEVCGFILVLKSTQSELGHCCFSSAFRSEILTEMSQISLPYKLERWFTVEELYWTTEVMHINTFFWKEWLPKIYCL